MTNYDAIAHLIPGITRYVQARIPTGSFLKAVLSNDLKEACARADYLNQHLLFEIVAYLYNEVPSKCWGSPEKVQAWLAANNDKGICSVCRRPQPDGYHEHPCE
jgi:hypothetical protein